MSHTKKKRGVPDKASGTPVRSVCGILCGQRKSAKSYSAQKLQKAKENTRNPRISGVSVELLGGFEPPTSSLPITFCAFSTLPVFCPLSSLSLVVQYFPGFSVLFFCLLSLAFLNLFGVLVWFLSGFLSATLTADLIPIGQKTRHNAPHLLSTPFYVILTLALPDSSGQPS